MNTDRTVFSQIMDFFPKYEFNKRVSKYNGNYRARTFTCWDQFLCMSFAQLSYRESLRDIEACLTAQPNKLYHMGIKGSVARTNLARANEKRNWRIYAEFAQFLIAKARKLYENDPNFTLQLCNTIYALDSTTIDLCLSVFPWAKFRTHKGAIKIHTLLDLRGSIPTFIEITEALLHDMNILDIIITEPGSFYIMDRGYLDFERLHRIKENLGYFIIKAKKNMKFRRRYSQNVDKSTGLRCDQTILMSGYYTKKSYPDKLRRVKYYDKTTKKSLVLLTNNFDISALTVAELYHNRWKIELFFKWIKQHLKIKAFYGTTQNAVKTQIWIAISTYVIVAIIKKQLNIELSLYTILQILSVSFFEKVSLLQLLKNSNGVDFKTENPNQLILFNS